MIKEYTALGLMTGSSLDGVDLAYCRFYESNNQWNYQIEVADTLDYPEEWKLFLLSSLKVETAEFLERDVKFGKYLGGVVNKFLKKNKLKPDIIASHGHTLFHKPERGFSIQMGSGQAIAVTTGIPTVSDFRTKDILLGGQGAPLVPIGDKLLFGNYDYCLNIGGIANVSFDENGLRKAYDICPANQLLNHLSRQVGMPYDKGGQLALKGNPNAGLLDLLNHDPYYQLSLPKSLSNEYVRESFVALLDDYQATVNDKLFSCVKHIAAQIAQCSMGNSGKSMLITGGGAHNTFLVDAIREAGDFKVVIPDKQIVDFKEALVFAFMGLLRTLDRENCLASATGATKNSSVGVIYYP